MLKSFRLPVSYIAGCFVVVVGAYGLLIGFLFILKLCVEIKMFSFDKINVVYTVCAVRLYVYYTTVCVCVSIRWYVYYSTVCANSTLYYTIVCVQFDCINYSTVCTIRRYVYYTTMCVCVLFDRLLGTSIRTHLNEFLNKLCSNYVEQ